jgi:CheY-like chemotaxis protein
MRVLVVDDDEVSREVLGALLEAEGYAVETATSGDEALVRLRAMEAWPDVVLTDMQMPGMRGDKLAIAVRALCGKDMVVLAMSGTKAEAAEFDGFVQKPFSMAELADALGGARIGAEKAVATTVLDKTVYAKLAAAMRQPQLEKLYELCLSDVEGRIARMREAQSDNDDATYRREAHAIKGGCGMVGAIELQSLATSMEERGLRDDHVASLDEFVLACGRLRRMLDAHEISHSRAD